MYDGNKNMNFGCMKWCFFKDPYDKQCRRYVMKNNKKVRCRRYGDRFHKERNKYYCEMHYEEIETDENSVNENQTEKISFDSTCECSSRD